MKRANYQSFFKRKPEKIEEYHRCKICGRNMVWAKDGSATLRCTKCGNTVHLWPYQASWEIDTEAYERMRNVFERNTGRM